MHLHPCIYGASYQRSSCCSRTRLFVRICFPLPRAFHLLLPPSLMLRAPYLLGAQHTLPCCSCCGGGILAASPFAADSSRTSFPQWIAFLCLPSRAFLPGAASWQLLRVRELVHSSLWRCASQPAHCAPVGVRLPALRAGRYGADMVLLRAKPFWAARRKTVVLCPSGCLILREQSAALPPAQPLGIRGCFLTRSRVVLVRTSLHTT